MRLRTEMDGNCVGELRPQLYALFKFCSNVCILTAYTYERNYLRRMLNQNDNSAIFFPVSASLLYQEQAKLVTVKSRRDSSRNIKHVATDRQTRLKPTNFHVTALWYADC